MGPMSRFTCLLNFGVCAKNAKQWLVILQKWLTAQKGYRHLYLAQTSWSIKQWRHHYFNALISFMLLIWLLWILATVFTIFVFWLWAVDWCGTTSVSVTKKWTWQRLWVLHSLCDLFCLHSKEECRLQAIVVAKFKFHSSFAKVKIKGIFQSLCGISEIPRMSWRRWGGYFVSLLMASAV